MKMSTRFLVLFTCLFLLLLPQVQDNAQAACAAPAQIVGDTSGYVPTSIQDAYNYASTTLGLASFTLRLPADTANGGTLSEDLVLDGGMVEFDGGYDCGYISKTGTTSLVGTITITTGAAKFAGGFGVASTPQCAFDNDADGFTSVGSCSGTADDCNDNDPNIYPGSMEICDGLDNNCDGQIDEGFTAVDADGDGYFASGCGSTGGDCNDNNPEIHPGAVDIPYDGIDQDCSGADMTYPDSNAGVFCTSCHGAATGWDAKHAAVSAPDTTCATCHAPEVANVLPGHFGQTVQTAGQQMIAGDTIGCVSCHDLDGTTTGSHNIIGFSLGDGDNVVWGPVIPVRGSVTCDTCHVNRATQHTTAVAHDNRAIDSTCGACHTSDPTILGSPGTGTLASAADVDALHGACATCHNYTGTRVDPRDVRDVIAQGVSGTPVSCTDCHINQATGHGNRSHTVQVGANDLSYDAPGQLCSVCHLDQSGTLVSDWTVIEAEHNVVTNGAGSCATCHNSSRQAVSDTIAAGADPTNCLACHADKELTVHGNPDHVALGYVIGGTTTCLNCHDPGTAANATVSTIHKDNCALCHTSVPALQTGLPAGGGDCLACHTSTWETLHSVNTPVHTNLVQVATTSCASCHTDPPPLTDAADLTNHNACASCHDANGGLIGSAVGAPTLTTGGNCTTCHGTAWSSLHSVANAPNHSNLVQVGTSTCGNCHDSTLLADTTLAGADTHTACTSCHDATTGALLSSASGKDFTTGGDCTTCHGTSWTSLHPVATAPSHNTLVTTSGTGTTGIGCAACHDDSLLVDATLTGVDTHLACATCHTSDGSLVTTLGTDTQVFDANGNCLTCHTGGFDSHNYVHDVSYDPLVDTSQTTQQGCAACHDDSGNGLVAFSDIVTEHLSCATCHAYTDDGQATPPQLTVDNTIATGTGVTCATCHTAKVPDVDHGVDHITSGLVAGTAECLTCHIDPAVTFTDANNPKVHNGCTTCHDATTNALKGSAIGHGSADAGFGNPNTCTTCHGADWGTLHATAPDHSALVTTTGTDNCASCHENALVGTTVTTHLQDCSNCHSAADGSLVGDAIGKTFAVGGTCETCHSTGWGSIHTELNAPTHNALVTVATTSCANCHTDPPPLTDAADLTNHNACATCHTANGSLTTVNGTNTQDFTTGGDCTSCHGNSWGTLHATAPDHSALVTTTGTDNCASCHENALVGATVTTHLQDCSNCHSAADGSLVGDAIGKTFAVGGNCETCHSTGWGSIHTELNAPTHNALVTVATTSCANCHTDPPPLTDAADLTNHNACATCHTANGSLTTVNGTNTQNFTTGGDCTSCHGNTWGTLHATAPDHSALVTTSGTVCADCHTNTLVSTGNKTHNACTTCHDSNSGALIGSATGVSGSGNCTTCHGGDVRTTHNNCTTCHAEPPNGGSFPNITGAHDAHDVIGFGSVTPSCNACHSSASHYSGATDVNILSSFDAQSGGAGSNGSTCSSTRCHGGQTTPDWQTGSLNVATDCLNCHDGGPNIDPTKAPNLYPDQYNDYTDNGRHKKHLDDGIDCIACHSLSKLANGDGTNWHFSNLQSTAFELDPRATVSGSDTVSSQRDPSLRESEYDPTGGRDGVPSCTLNCHGKDHSNEDWD